MGIGITGMSKAKLLPCPNDESSDPECIEEHLTVGTPGSGKDAVKMGCYVPGRGGRTSDLDFKGENLDWMWESYQQFRRAFRLAKNAGIVVFY